METVDKIAVLIPCYNEGATIGKVVGDFAAALPGAVIYVYDNNSSDGTAEIAARAGAVVRREYKQGKGNVIRRMFREIDAQCYVMTDGDDTYPAEDAPKMAEQVLGRGVDMVIGDRLSATYFTENKRPFHNTGNRLVRALINFLFKNDVRDIMTGYRAFSYGFVKTFPVLSHGFEIETEMTIHCLDKNLSLSSVVVDYRDRPEGSVSKLNTYRDGARVLRTVFSLYKDYRPFQFFSILALLLLLIGMIFLLPVVVEYARTGLVPRFPSFFASGFFALGALQSFFGGMILDTIVKDRRQEFEIRLNEFQHFYSGLLENPGK